MSCQIRNYRLRRPDDHWDTEVVARFDASICVGEEPFTEELIFRECELVEAQPGRFRIVPPCTEEGQDAFSLPECWKTPFQELAVSRYQRSQLFGSRTAAESEYEL